MKRITVSLTDEQLQYMEQLQKQQKETGGFSPSINQIIRGIIHKLMERNEK